MRRLLLLAASAAALLMARPAQAGMYVSAGVSIGAPVETVTFHQRLAPYGRWVRTASYGEVWVPGGVAVGWRPYSDGRWVLTEYGWTFVSDDPWGWATWHYGNWVMADQVGWVWVPGRVWAPAWVSWRYGGGYAAWAPMPPRWASVTYVYSSPAWVVVQQQHFTQPIAQVSVSATIAAGAVQRAAPIAGPVQAGNIAVNAGPRPQAVAQAVGHPVQPVAAGAVVGHGTASIARAPRAPAAPAAVQQHLAQHWNQQAVRGPAQQPKQWNRPQQQPQRKVAAVRPQARKPAKRGRW